MAQKTTPVKRGAGKKPRASSRSGLWVVVIVLLVAALIFVGYMLLCTQVTDGKLLDNVFVNDVDLSGMTQQEADAALQADFSEKYKGKTIDVLLEGDTYTVPLWDDNGNLLTLDTSAVLEEAMAYGHGPFLNRGLDWVQSHSKHWTQSVTPKLTDRDGLIQRLSDSGLESVNTAVDTTYSVGEDTVTVTKGTPGVVADLQTAADGIISMVDSTQWPEQTTLDCATSTSDIADLDMEKIYSEVYSDPVNATLDKDNDYAVTESRQGVSFDKDAAKAALDEAAPGETFSFDLIYTDPEISTQELKDRLFRDKLGSYTTNVSGSSGRKSNVKLAAQYCNGTILLPGETFSYNNVVGQRTKERGFSEAPAYLNGKTIQEVGGGICQVSSTLYSACLYANLEIVNRTNHSFASSYIPLGMDATVSWGGPDYEFRNNTDYPIKVVGSYSGGQVTLAIYGTKTDNVTVKITSETLDTIPYTTVYKEDSDYSSGETISTPYTGYKVQTYRKLYDGDGNLISSNKEAYSYYQKRDRVIAE